MHWTYKTPVFKLSTTINCLFKTIRGFGSNFYSMVDSFLIVPGAPIPIVAISLAVSGTKSYAANNCWLTAERWLIYWAFVAPVAVILVVSILFCLWCSFYGAKIFFLCRHRIIWGLYCEFRGEDDSREQISDHIFWLIGTYFLSMMSSWLRSVIRDDEILGIKRTVNYTRCWAKYS